jgi:hypothetical protein
VCAAIEKWDFWIDQNGGLGKGDSGKQKRVSGLQPATGNWAKVWIKLNQ